MCINVEFLPALFILKQNFESVLIFASIIDCTNHFLLKNILRMKMKLFLFVVMMVATIIAQAEGREGDIFFKL